MSSLRLIKSEMKSHLIDKSFYMSLAWLRSLLDYLYGFDVFISYTRRDDPQSLYPLALQATLTQGSKDPKRAPMRCFLDLRDLPHDEELKKVIERKVQSSKYVLFVAGRNAENHTWMCFEAAMARKHRRRMFVIDRGINWPENQGKLKEVVGDVLAIPSEPEDSKPGDEVVRISETLGSKRKENFRRNLWVCVVALLSLLLAISAFFGWQAEMGKRFAERQKSEAERQTAEAERQTAEAERQTAEAERRAYNTSVIAATSKYEAGLIPDALSILEASTAKNRQWEAEHLHSMLDNSSLTKNFGNSRPLMANVGFFADGINVLTSFGSKLVVWNSDDGSEKFTVNIPDGGLSVADLNLQGTRMISSSNDGYIRLWDISKRGLIRKIKGGGAAARGTGSIIPEFRFSPDGTSFLAFGDGTNCRLFDSFTGEEQFVFASDQELVAFSGDGESLITVSQDNVQYWDTKSGNLLGHRTIDGMQVADLSVNRDGSKVALSLSPRRLVPGADRESTAARIEVLDTAGWKLKGSLQGSRSPWTGFFQIRFAPDERALFAIANGILYRWRLDDPKNPDILEPRNGSKVTKWSISEDGASLLVNSGTELLLVSSDDLRVNGSLNGQRTKIESFSASPDHTRAVALTTSGYAKVWQVSNLNSFSVIKMGAKQTGDICVSDNVCKWVECIDSDRNYLVKNDGDRVPLHDIQGQISHVSFSQNGQRVAITSFEGALAVYEASSSGKLIRSIDHPSKRDRRMLGKPVFSNDGKLLISRMTHENACVWNLDTGLLLNELNRNSNVAAFSDDDTQIVTSGIDSQSSEINKIGNQLLSPLRFSAIIWDVKSGEEITRWNIQGQPKQVCFSSDSSRLAIAYGGSNVIEIWKLRDSSHPIKEISVAGHRMNVTGLDFSRSGERLLSSSDDGIVSIWDTKTGVELMRLSGHAGPTLGARFDELEKNIITFGIDRTIRIWKGREF